MFVIIFLLPKSTKFKRHEKKRNANFCLFLWFLDHLEPIWVKIYFFAIIHIFPCSIKPLIPENKYFLIFKVLNNFFTICPIIYHNSRTQSYTCEESFVSALLCLRNCSFMTNGWPRLSHEQLYKQQFQNKWQS